jgi:acylphosphatase
MSVRRYRVTGRVQGVGFRYFVYREATTMGIDGWVRNRADGTVEALVAASDEDHAILRCRLEQGPRISRVTAVEEVDELDEAVTPGFEIRQDGS